MNGFFNWLCGPSQPDLPIEQWKRNNDQYLTWFKDQASDWHQVDEVKEEFKAFPEGFKKLGWNALIPSICLLGSVVLIICAILN